MLEGLTPPLDNTLCLLGQKALELSEDDKKVLEASLEDPRWTSSALKRALDERGFSVGDTVMLKHRKKECACARKSE